jgi:60 kDa SS-A/Ro ribonucleoprotein
VAYRQADSAEAQVRILDSLSVRWDLLSDAAKGPLVWKAIARQMGPQALRMNLNTLARHGVLDDAEMVEYVAERLASPDEIRRSRQFPYQFLAAYMNVGDAVPQRIKTVLHDAAEIACGNVPVMPGPVVIGLDVSGSMSSAATGTHGEGATSSMRCVDVAALFAAAVLRRNPESIVIPFDTQAYVAEVDPSDKILSLSARLAQYGGGGTDCSLPLKAVNQRFPRRKFAACVLVSDNASWQYAGQAFATGTNGATGVMTEWTTFVANQRRLGVTRPKLVCIDIQVYGTGQAPESRDILNIGGFSDAVFQTVAAFVDNGDGRFVAEVESIEL